MYVPNLFPPLTRLFCLSLTLSPSPTPTSVCACAITALVKTWNLSTRTKTSHVNKKAAEDSERRGRKSTYPLRPRARCQDRWGLCLTRTVIPHTPSQKPVRHLVQDERVTEANAANLRSAATAALLLLPPQFDETQLHTALCGLSYTGDVRMALAEDRHKVCASAHCACTTPSSSAYCCLRCNRRVLLHNRGSQHKQHLMGGPPRRTSRLPRDPFWSMLSIYAYSPPLMNRAHLFVPSCTSERLRRTFSALSLADLARTVDSPLMAVLETLEVEYGG